MNLRATQLDSGPELRTAGTKFLYASGAKPLAGYTIKRGVGRGGFGEVYYAVSDAGKEVALKLIRRNLDIELRGVTHCLNLKHPNLLSIFDVKQDDQDNSWIVMEYVSGESLDEVIARHPDGMPPEMAMEWLRGIAGGVAYLHDHGIVHRDLKPGNVFSDEGLVKLGDYGLSKFISCSRRSGQTESIGTVHYMAPEVANGRYGKEIDIYALGIMLYEMLAGRVPFDGESVGEVLMKHLTAAPDLSSIAEPFRSVIERTLAKDPDVRFASVAELMAALPAAGTAPAHAPSPMIAGSQSPRRGLTEVGVRAQAAAPPAPPLPRAGGASEEPISRAVRNFFRNVSEGWANLPVLAQVVLVVVGVMLVIASSPVWIVAIPALVVLYCIYLLVRSMVVGSPPKSAAREVRTSDVRLASGGGSPQPAAVDVAGQGQFARRKRWRDKSIALPPVVLSPRERLAELVGSLLFSAGVVAAIGVVMVLLRNASYPEQSEWRPEQYAWLTLVGILGSWSVLIPAKFWEGRKPDPALRRFVLLVIGMGVGALAYGIQTALLVQLPYGDNLGLPSPVVSTGSYALNGSPLLFAHLAYFGFLFMVLRWWRQADPQRSSRLSLWFTGWCLFAAWALNLLWQYPQPWGLMVAATISIAVQLASPWRPRGRVVSG